MIIAIISYSSTYMFVYLFIYLCRRNDAYYVKDTSHKDNLKDLRFNSNRGSEKKKKKKKKKVNFIFKKFFILIWYFFSN